MTIARWINAGPAVAALAALFLIAPALQHGWASEGGGGIEFYYSDDEDDDKDKIETLEATPSAYSAPESFGLSVRAKYGFGNDLNFQLTYRVEEDLEKPTSFTVDSAVPALNLRPEYRLRWRFPESDYQGTDDDKDDEPASTLSLPTIRYRFSTWTSFDALEAIEEDPLKGLDPDKYVWDDDEGLGLRIGDSIIKVNISLEAARAFEKWATEEITRARVANWLGDEAFEKFQTQFGPAADDAGAEDLSGWGNIRIYCGATCVGRYY